MRRFVMKGNICYSNDNKELCVIENGYVVSEDGICLGVYEQLPEKYQMIPCYDYTDRLIIPDLQIFMFMHRSIHLEA